MNAYEEGVLRPSLEIKGGYAHMFHAELRLLRTFNLLPKSISPTHYLFLGSQNKIFQPYCRHPQISPRIHSRAPKEGKLKQTEHPSFSTLPKKLFMWALVSTSQFGKLLSILLGKGN